MQNSALQYNAIQYYPNQHQTMKCRLERAKFAGNLILYLSNKIIHDYFPCVPKMKTTIISEVNLERKQADVIQLEMRCYANIPDCKSRYPIKTLFVWISSRMRICKFISGGI